MYEFLGEPLPEKRKKDPYFNQRQSKKMRKKRRKYR